MKLNICYIKTLSVYLMELFISYHLHQLKMKSIFKEKYSQFDSSALANGELYRFS